MDEEEEPDLIKIRNAKIDDIVPVKRLLNTKELDCQAFSCQASSSDYFERLILDDDGSIFLVAEYNSKVVGIIFGEFSEEENWADLMGVAVLEEYRGKRIGSTLIKTFEDIVDRNNVTYIALYANVDTLAKYIDKLGYEKRGTFVYCRKIKK